MREFFQLIADVLQGNSTTTDPGNLQAAVTAFANLQATIWTAIRTNLTESQITILDGIATDIGKATRITAMIEKRFAELQNWIAKH